MKHNECKLTVAEITIAAYSKDFSFNLLKIDQPQEIFFSDQDKEDFRMDVISDKSFQIPESRVRYTNRSGWELRIVEDTCYWSFKPVSEKKIIRVFVTDVEFTSGKLYIIKEEVDGTVSPFGYLLSEIIYTGILPRYNAILIHASALKFGNYAVVFSGESGSGKSTIAELFSHSDKATILSDESIIIRKNNENIICYGTPWPGTSNLYKNDFAELKKILFIKHGSENQILKNTKEYNFELLLKNCFLLKWSEKGIVDTLDILEEIMNIVDLKLLSFVPDENIINFVIDNFDNSANNI